MIMRIYEAEDGFRGTYDEVVEHEEKFKQAQNSITVGDDSEDNSNKVLFRIYEAEDGFRSTFDEVVEHEKELELLAKGQELGVTKKLDSNVPGDDEDKVVVRIYESSDGFRGTYDEVVEHEKELELLAKDQELDVTKKLDNNVPGDDVDKIVVRIYESSDGFRGTYDEVVEHEKKCNLTKSDAAVGSDSEDVNDKVVVRIYESSDGFRGTYDEVVEHEKEFGLPY